MVVAGFLPYVFQIRQPRVLLGYWRTVFVISLLLPLLQPWHHAHIMGAFVVAPDIAGSTLRPAPEPTVTQWLLPSPQIIIFICGLVIWTGIAVRLAILVLGLRKLRQFRKASSTISPFSESAAVFEEMRNHLNARAEFRLSAHVDSPVTFGFAAPVILLPERTISMNKQFQAAIACHELVHVRRHDWANHLGEEAIRAVFWFHPGILWLIARVRLTREQVVDFEVVRLTHARKAYLEALLEFATGRRCAATVSAPPFLVERQLVERVALMSQEVRMSRARLIASLAAIACCLVLVTTMVARTFPLKGAPLAAQSAPAEIAPAVPGHSPSNAGQAASGDHQSTAAGSPRVERSNIWIDTVKEGPMVRQVRGLGTLAHEGDSPNLVARVALPEVMTAGVQLNQTAVVDTHKGLVKGHVSRIGASPANGTRSVEIALDAALPEGVGAGLQVDGMIDIEKLDNVVYIGRPVHGAENSSVFLFKIVNDGTQAIRVNVKLGRASADAIEVLDGLRAGDKVILSDMSNWANVDRVNIR